MLTYAEDFRGAIKRSRLSHLMDRSDRPYRVRQMQGQSPEGTGGVYDDIRRGFPRGDNEADDVL